MTQKNERWVLYLDVVNSSAEESFGIISQWRKKMKEMDDGRKKEN